MGQGFGWMLIGLGVLHLLAGLLIPGIWYGLIGMFLMNAARGSYKQVLIREALQGETVREFMNPQPISVPSGTDLLHWVDDYVYRYHLKTFPVASNGQLEGVISTRALSRFPRTEWVLHTVGEAMDNLEPACISPEADAVKALSQMMSTGSSRLLVAEGDHLVGIISLKDLLRFLDLKMELQEMES
jgi:CBS domain-containing protein